MNIGIIIHSETGNTLSVAEKVRERLATAGHVASIERIAAVGGLQPNVRTVELEALPDIGKYDALVFAGPVRGMSASPVIATCMGQVPSLAGMKIACFVTEQFPYAWMGGSAAIAKMKTLCQAKQGRVEGTWIVNWSSKRRDEQITGLLDGVAKLF